MARRVWSPRAWRSIGIVCVAASSLWAAEPVDASETLKPDAGSDTRELLLGDDFDGFNDAGIAIGTGVQMPRFWYPIGRDPQSPAPGFLDTRLHRLQAGRAGFPRHPHVGFSREASASGDFSLGLESRGGNAGAYLQVGAAPATAGSDYQITLRCHTRGLESAAAEVAAYLVGSDGRRLPGTGRSVTGLRSPDGWQAVRLNLPGRHVDAAWIGLELRLMQDVRDVADVLGEQRILTPDTRGWAFFDDIAIHRVPRVELTLERAGSDGSGSVHSAAVHVVAAPERPGLAALVRDLGERPLQVRLRALDLHGRVVAERRVPAVRDEAGEARVVWEPELPGYGWFEAELAVYEGRVASDVEPAQRDFAEVDDRPTVVARTAFLWLPDASAWPTATDRFVLDATGVVARAMPHLPTLIRSLGLRRTMLSVWDQSSTRDTLQARRAVLDEVARDLAASGARWDLSFEPVPSSLADAPRGGQAVASADEEAAVAALWADFATPTLLKHGQGVAVWQMPEGGKGLGAAGAYRRLLGLWAPGAALRAGLADADHVSRSGAGEQVERGELVERGGPGGADGRLILMAAEASPAEVAEGLPVGGEAADGVRLAVLPSREVTHPERSVDLALRVLHTWHRAGDQGHRALPTLLMPVAWRHGLGGSEATAAQVGVATGVVPDPLLGVFAGLARELSGRRVVGTIDLEPGVVCWLLDGPAGPSMVAWNESAPPGTALNLYIGPSPVVHDLWGNRLAVPSSTGRQRVELGAMPVFLHGIDGELARFRSAFRLDEPMVPSLQIPHERLLRLTNPWDTTLFGEFQITGPEGWGVTPRRQTFSIAAGQTLEQPIRLTFPPNEAAEEKVLSARLVFDTDRRYEIELGAPMRLGLEHLELQASMRITRLPDPAVPGGTRTDAIITCLTTNTGSEPVSLNVFATHAGQPYSERLIPLLEPGQSLVRSFRFNGVDATIHSLPVLCGVRETNGPAVLNQHLTLDAAGG